MIHTYFVRTGPMKGAGQCQKHGPSTLMDEYISQRRLDGGGEESGIHNPVEREY